jgi:hypothetical protein
VWGVVRVFSSKLCDFQVLALPNQIVIGGWRALDEQLESCLGHFRTQIHSKLGMECMLRVVSIGSCVSFRTMKEMKDNEL